MEGYNKKEELVVHQLLCKREIVHLQDFPLIFEMVITQKIPTQKYISRGQQAPQLVSTKKEQN